MTCTNYAIFIGCYLAFSGCPMKKRIAQIDAAHFPWPETTEIRKSPKIDLRKSSATPTVRTSLTQTTTASFQSISLSSGGTPQLIFYTSSLSSFRVGHSMTYGTTAQKSSQNSNRTLENTPRNALHRQRTLTGVNENRQ